MKPNDTTPLNTANPSTAAGLVTHLATTTAETDPNHDAATPLDDSDTPLAAFATEVAADLAAHLSTPSNPAPTRRGQEQYAALLLSQPAQGLATVELARQVETSTDLCDQFDLHQTPSQGTLSWAWRRQFTSRDRRAITAPATLLRRLYTAHQHRTA